MWNCGKKGHLKKYRRAPKKKGDRQQETTQEVNVASYVLQDALILSLDNTSDYWVVDSRDSCHATPHSNIVMIIFEVILDMFYWGMMNHVKLLEWIRYGLI